MTLKKLNLSLIVLFISFINSFFSQFAIENEMKKIERNSFNIAYDDLKMMYKYNQLLVFYQNKTNHYHQSIKFLLNKEREKFKKKSENYYIHMITEMEVLRTHFENKFSNEILHQLENDEKLKKHKLCYHLFLIESSRILNDVNLKNEAINRLKRLLKNLTKDEPYFLFQAYSYLGNFFLEKKEFKTAKFFIEKSYPYLKKTGLQDFTYKTNLSIALIGLKKNKEAEKLLLDVYQTNKNSDGNIELNLGEFYLDENNLILAKKLLNEASKLSIKSNNTRNQLATFESQIKLALKTKDFKGAILYEQLKDSLLIQIDNTNFVRIKDSLEIAKSIKKIDEIKKNSQYKIAKSNFNLNQIFIILIILFIISSLMIAFQIYTFRKNKHILIQQIKNINWDIKKTIKNENHEAYNELINQFEMLLINKEWYKKNDLNLIKISKRLDTNTTDLSEAINNYYNENFRTIVNQIRISEAKKLLINPEYNKYSMDTLAEEVGYLNLSTFNKNFKEITGLTPTFFRSQYKNIKVID